MKRILLIGLVILTAAACKKVQPEDRVTAITEYFSQNEDEFAARLAQYEGDKRIDYLSLVLGNDLGTEDIWLLETEAGSSILANFPGVDKEETEPVISLLSAPVDDPAACAAALNVLKAFKKLKIAHKNDIRAFFYDPQVDSLGQSGLTLAGQDFKEAKDIILFNLVLTSQDTLTPHRIVIEDKKRFTAKINEVVKPYFAPLGEFEFVQGAYYNPEWPLQMATYRFHVDKGQLMQDAAAATVFSMLLN